MSLGLLVYCPNLSLSWSVGSVQIFLSKSQRSKLPTIKPGREENNQQDQDWWRRIISFKMQDCEPSGTFHASLKHLPVIERVHFFQIFYYKRMVRVSFPGYWGTLTLMLWLLPYKVGILEETLGQLSIRRRTVDNYHRPSPAWHLALERARALKVFLWTQATKSIEPEQAKTEETSVLG